MLHYSFHWRPVFEALPQMLAGCLVTIEIAALATVIGIVVGLALALARIGGNKIAAGFGACPWMDRGRARTRPDSSRIYLAYFGLGGLGMHLEASGGVDRRHRIQQRELLAEVFRGGLRAIPSTQTRAARSLGMPAGQAFRLIVLPQLFRIVYYPITNQMIFSVLMTALGLTVGLDTDLAGVTQKFNVLTYRTFEYFTAWRRCCTTLIAKAMMAAARLLAWRLFRY